MLKHDKQRKFSDELETGKCGGCAACVIRIVVMTVIQEMDMTRNETSIYT
jgi:hypothetical protein